MFGFSAAKGEGAGAGADGKSNRDNYDVRLLIVALCVLNLALSLGRLSVLLAKDHMARCTKRRQS